MRNALALATIALALVAAGKPDGNRLAYLDDNDPYYPGLNFPRLTTPQWVGEPGVEAVVVLAIDDMRDPAQYEAFLRPILNRLKAIDGRAPVSIMTCQVKPDDPRLQAWLKEGLNFDVHTIAHPCPLLQKSDFAAAQATENECIDLLNTIPNNRPVAFRMPCCDSRNTLSPRFFAEIFNRKTSEGHSLSIDSSVFNILTPADPSLPRSLVEDPDGGERFRKYLPFKSFVNTIENYPYPYVINRLCWEFPCVVPSDWEAQNIHKPANPRTVEDMKAALDAVVLKQGVFNLVFHPYGWIKPEQVVEVIDHAVKTHGKKVKFLNFREAQERIDKHLLNGHPLRDPEMPDRDNGIRLIDLNHDGFLDVVTANEATRETRIWDPKSAGWKSYPLPGSFTLHGWRWSSVRFGQVRDDGRLSVLAQFYGILPHKPGEYFALDGTTRLEAFVFGPDGWSEDRAQVEALRQLKYLTRFDTKDEHVSALRDIDGDGIDELFVVEAGRSGKTRILAWNHGDRRWQELPFTLPEGASPASMWVVCGGRLFEDAGTRFVDLDEDGRDDVVFSDGERFGVFLFDSMKTGWSRQVAAGKAADPGAIPPIVRWGKDRHTTDNGFWVHSRSLWWQNEDTDKLPELVDRRSFNELLKDVTPRGKTAEAARRAIRVRPGFRVEIAASEPLVLDPIAFDWGADGRLWVLEMGDYPLGVDGKGKPGGQVRILEDLDQDGRYDKVSVFLDGLGFPSGLMPWRNGVLVGSAPDIFYAEDTDGDGKADRREVLFSGFAPGNQQHRLNGFELGLDGWVYGANGDSGGVVKSIKTGKVVDIRGRDFRFQPDTGAFEPESGQTQYGRHRDDWGRWFGDNNPNWGWHYVLPNADLRRNTLYAPPDPRKTLEPDTRLYPASHTAARFNNPGSANRVTSANSATPYRDDLFGPHFSNSLFISEPVHNLVHRMVLEPDGPSLKGGRAPGEADREFLASSDAWFRPTMLKTGPDGALWVADMDRAVIEHPEWIPNDWEKRLDLRAGADRGRIFRVVPVDQTPRPIERLDRLDTAGLVAALDSPNGWRRDTAHRLLLHKADKDAIEPLRALVLATKNPKTRVQALWVLENLGGLAPEPVIAALVDPHPQVRRNAARVSETLLAGHPDVADALLKLVDDPDSAVRLELALVLGNWPDLKAGKALVRIARRDGSDPWCRAAIVSSAVPHVATLLAGLFEGPGSPPEGLVAPLFVLAGSGKSRDGMRSLLATVTTPTGPQGQFAAWQFSAFAGLLDAAQRAGQSLDHWAGQDAEPEHLNALWQAARATVSSAEVPLDTRLAAAALLGRDSRQRDAERTLLAALLKPQTPATVQLAAVSAVARDRDPKLPDTLLAGWKGYTPALRSAVLDALLGRKEWTAALLSSLEDTCTPPGEIDPAHRLQLLGHTDKTLRERAAAVFGADRTSRREVLDRYRPALATPGDPKAGAVVFQRVCAACHKLGGQGTEVGADLAALDDRSPEALLTAILDPNRAFEAKYTEYSVALNDGRVKTGMIASESAASITLRRQQGEQDEVLRSDIEAMTSTGRSLMPEGLEKDITPRDLADLIALLNATAPPSKPKAFAGNTPQVVAPQADGTLILKAETAEVHGATLVFEGQYKNLGYWSSANDHAAWRFEAVKAGDYEVWLDWAVEDSTAGQVLSLRAGDATLTHKVAGTGSWDIYKQAKIGTIHLSAGPGRLEVRAAERLRGPLIDLRTVELRPVAAPCCP